MGLFRTLKSIVNSEVMGEEIISTIEKMYSMSERNFPNYDPHMLLAMTFTNRTRTIGTKITEDMQLLALSETRLFAALPPPSNSRALGLFFLFKERPDIVTKFPKFSAQLEALMSPIYKAVNDHKFESLYQRYNPSMKTPLCGDVRASHINEVISAEEVGAGLYKYVSEVRDSERELAKKHNIELTKKVLTQLFLLKTATVGIYIRMNFDDEDDFNDDEFTCDFLDAAFFDFLKNKLGKKLFFDIYGMQSAYVAAYDETDFKESSWEIGKVFAKNCGEEMNMQYVLFGSLIFASKWTATEMALTEITQNFRRKKGESNIEDDKAKPAMKDIEEWKKKGDIFLIGSKFQEAIDCYNKVLDINPKDADTLQKKENALCKLIKHQEAKAINTGHDNAQKGQSVISGRRYIEIQPPRIRSKESPREILAAHFKSLGTLPIHGGWGYTLDDAVIIDKNDPVVPKEIPFDGVGLEYIFVGKRIYEELIIMRPENDIYAGIKWKLLRQELLNHDGKSYDRLIFEVTAIPDKDWQELKAEWEGSNGHTSQDFDIDGHLKKRDSKTIRYVTEYYFDINSFYGKN